MELLLFFVMFFLCFTLLLHTGTPLSGTILRGSRGFSFSFSFSSLVKITAMFYLYQVLFFNIFPTFGVTLGLFMINGFINGVYRSTGIVLGLYVPVFGLSGCRLWDRRIGLNFGYVSMGRSMAWNTVDEYKCDWEGFSCLFFSLARLLVLCELSRYSTFSHISTLLSQPICEFTIVLLCNSLTSLNIISTLHNRV